MKFTLIDQTDTTKRVQGEVKAEKGDLWIHLDGYGEKGAADGYGTPIGLELYEGRLRLLVWADINQEDPTHTIALDQASEDSRQ